MRKRRDPEALDCPSERASWNAQPPLTLTQRRDAVHGKGSRKTPMRNFRTATAGEISQLNREAMQAIVVPRLSMFHEKRQGYLAARYPSLVAAPTPGPTSKRRTVSCPEIMPLECVGEPGKQRSPPRTPALAPAAGNAPCVRVPFEVDRALGTSGTSCTKLIRPRKPSGADGHRRRAGKRRASVCHWRTPLP
jgi:hypothetical protein